MTVLSVLPYKPMRRFAMTFACLANVVHGRAYRLCRAFNARESRNVLPVKCVLGDTLGLAMRNCIIHIAPFKASRCIYRTCACCSNVRYRHSKTSTCFRQRWKNGNIFTIERHLDYCTSQFTICYAIFTRNLSIGAVVFRRAPFEVVNTVVRSTLISMIHEWKIVRVRNKRLRNEPMDHNKFLLALSTQRYTVISSFIFVGVQNHSIVDTIRTRINAPHVADFVEIFIADYVPPFFFFHLLIFYYADKLKKKRKGYQLTLVNGIANSIYPFPSTNILKFSDLNKFCYH